MHIRKSLAGALALALMAVPAHAQTNQGTSPLSGTKGGTNNAFMQFIGPATPIKTYTLPNANSTLAALGTIQTWTGAQSFSDGTLVLLGSSSGSVTLHAPATGGVSATFFTGTDTVVGLNATQTLANKTLTTPVLGTATGTTLALNGATIGSNALAVNGATALGGASTITSTAAGALSVGANGATNPQLQVDASAGSVASGLKIAGAAANGGVFISTISSATNETLSINGKGGGGVVINNGGTGGISLAGSGGVTISSAITYGGVTLNNAVTGTGNMVLSNSPTFSGTVAGAGTHPLSVLATGTQDSLIGYFSSTAAGTISLPNCSNALTYSTSTHTVGCNTLAGSGTVAAAGTGLSLTGGGSTLNLALTNATMQSGSLSPTGTSSTGGQVMMGLGSTCKLTPVYSGRILVNFQAGVTNSGTSSGNIVALRYGTGAAPANAGAAAGTIVGSAINAQIQSAAVAYPLAESGIITGLTPGTAYWFDLGLQTTAGTATLQNVSCNAMEF